MFNINPDLRNDILEDMPPDWPPVTKAAYIYNQLCATLQYSTEYFLEEDKVRDWYTNPDNLVYVDGVNNNEVVCFTFNAIFAQLLIDADVCQEDMINGVALMTDDGKSFAPFHASLGFVTHDSHSFDVDSTQGILNRCDLTLTKFGDCAFSGWMSTNATPNEIEDDLAALARARRQIYSPADTLRGLAYKYITAKSGEFKTMSLQERFDLFMTYLKDTPEYSVESFTYMLKLKNTLFTKEEVGQIGDKCNFEISFLKDATTNELKAMVLFNPEGYVKDKGFENFDSLQIYEFSVKNRTITSGIDREELAEKISTMQYVQPKDTRARAEMIVPREARITPIPPEGEDLVWDEQQNPINVDHYERTEVLTGNRYVCDQEGNPISQNQTPTI